MIAAIDARKSTEQNGSGKGGRRIHALALVAALLFTHALVDTSEAGSWVVIHPDLYTGPPGFWAVWHAIWHRNTWIVVAAYDSAKPCTERAGRDFRDGALPLAEFKAKRIPLGWTDEQLGTLQSTLMQARCMPTELAEKIGTLRVSDMVR